MDPLNTLILKAHRILNEDQAPLITEREFMSEVRNILGLFKSAGVSLTKHENVSFNVHDRGEGIIGSISFDSLNGEELDDTYELVLTQGTTNDLDNNIAQLSFGDGNGAWPESKKVGDPLELLKGVTQREIQTYVDEVKDIEEL